MTKVVCLFLLIGLTAAVARGQDAPKEVVPAVELQVIPGDKIGEMSLDDMLDYLQAKVPGFNSTVVRLPGTPKDYPKIPQMTLKNVTLGQFLELLRTSYPGVTINRIDGKGPAGTPLYVVQVLTQQNGMSLFNNVPATEIKPVVKVYRLTEIISNMGGDPKKSMDDILSLVQAALDETGGDIKNQPVLKLHQPTQTLVFKGMPDKMELLEQVLDSLRPKESEQLAKLNQELKSDSEDLDKQQQQLSQYEIEKKRARDQIVLLQAELADARNELKAEKQPTTRP